LAILIPRFYTPDSQRYFGKDISFNLGEYLKLVKSRIFIFPFENLFEFWEKLNYPKSDLKTIQDIEHNDWISLWLLSSKFLTETRTINSIEKYSEYVISNIVAEDLPNGLSIEAIIKSIKDDFSVLSEFTLLENQKELKFHDVYFAETSNNLQNWQPVATSQSNIYLVFDGLLFKIG